MTGTRGLQNNNPGNIRRDGTQWEGMAPEQTDTAFVVFLSPEYGIRAMAKLLLNYQRIYGLRTIREIISRWAPPSENPTKIYIDNVSEWTGYGPDDPLSLENYEVMRNILAAIIRQENGKQPYSLAQLHGGIELAGIAVPNGLRGAQLAKVETVEEGASFLDAINATLKGIGGLQLVNFQVSSPVPSSGEGKRVTLSYGGIVPPMNPLPTAAAATLVGLGAILLLAGISRAAK